MRGDDLANDTVGNETAARGELVQFMTILAELEGIEVGVNEGVGTRKGGLGVYACQWVLAGDEYKELMLQDLRKCKPGLVDIQY